MTIHSEPRRRPFFAIGALARQAGVAVDTIRFYEKQGLLSSPSRTASGYRQYDGKALEQVRFIRRAKDLGFTLGEIKELLALENDREHGVQAVKMRAQQRVKELEFRIAEMMHMPGRG
jgi:MerR family copper efflux transcriptional regulator